MSRHHHKQVGCNINAGEQLHKLSWGVYVIHILCVNVGGVERGYCYFCDAGIFLWCHHLHIQPPMSTLGWGVRRERIFWLGLQDGFYTYADYGHNADRKIPRAGVWAIKWIKSSVSMHFIIHGVSSSLETPVVELLL